MIRPALALALLLALPSAAAAVETRLTTWLVLDPQTENRLVLDVPDALPGPPERVALVHGGVRATVIVDLLDLLLNRPTVADVEVEEIRIASEPIFFVPGDPSTSTGTMCVVGDPDKPSEGTVSLPVGSPPLIDATLATRSYPQSFFGDLVPQGNIALEAEFHDEVRADLRSLFLNELTTGPVAVDATAEGMAPVPGLGLLPFELELHILNSLTPPDEGPLLTQCRDAGFY